MAEETKKTGKEAREAKLAQALRANLRRRKAGDAPKPRPPSEEKS